MLLALLLAGCPAGDDKPGTTEPVDTGPFDADGDGFVAAEDCDDTHAEAFPGNPEDPPGDGIDGDCDGVEGVPFEGCTPIDVPDVYATIEDALADGERNICLGPGTYSPAGPSDTTPSAFRGQGRLLTTIVDPMAYYSVGVLDGLTATGALVATGNLFWQDVTLRDGEISGMENFTCTRCAMLNAPVVIETNELIAGLALADSWLTGAEEAVVVRTRGCRSNCSAYVDIRPNNSTFSDNGVDFAFDLEGAYNIYFNTENSVYVGETVAVVTEDNRGSSVIHPSGNGNVVWAAVDEPFPDGSAFTAREEDPMLDMSFAPPRPMEGSPLVDAAGSDGTSTDFWGVPRKVADRGAVER